MMVFYQTPTGEYSYCTLVTLKVPLLVKVWMVLPPAVVIVPPVAVKKPVV